MIMVKSKDYGVDYIGIVPPSYLYVGMTWFNPSTNVLRIYTGTQWISIVGMEVTQP